MENLPIALPKVTETVEAAPALPPVEPQGGGVPWGGIGYGVLIVAVIAIATKVLSD